MGKHLECLNRMKVMLLTRSFSVSAAKAAASLQKKITVYRYDGCDTKGAPRKQTYDLDVTGCNMILDILMKLKEMDPTLNFRRSCREGICGSCGVNVQGANKLACISSIPTDSHITILPLPHMYVINDLVVDMSHFYEQYNSIRPYIIRQNPPKMGEKQYAQSIDDNNKLIGLYECVLCACCSTSCPSYWWNGRRFLGPATLMHAYRWVIDTRDEDTTRRLADLRDDFKAYRCHAIFSCVIACPKGLTPGIYIQYLKRLIAGLSKVDVPHMNPMMFFTSSK